jgi:hypothetical protein
VTHWEYLIVALPRFEAPTASRQSSLAVRTLNDEGARGWEAVGMTLLDDGSIAVLLKRPTGSSTSDTTSDGS